MVLVDFRVVHDVVNCIGLGVDVIGPAVVAISDKSALVKGVACLREDPL